MNKLYFILITILFSISLKQAYAQKVDVHKLIVQLNNAPFDSLFAYEYTNSPEILIKGEKIAAYTWEFVFPDSIALNSERMYLTSSFYNAADTSNTTIRFKSPFQQPLPIVNIGFQDRNNHIYADYFETTILENEHIQTLDSTILGKMKLIDFELNLKEGQSDINVRSHDPNFAWFYGNTSNGKNSYEDFVDHYISIAEKFSNSRFLLYQLSDNLLNFKNKKDVKTLFNLISYRGHEGWVKKIENYLREDFYNSKLPNLAKGQPEYIIEDSTKFNLIIFSASWCVPCIEEIPLIKEIYADLNTNLNITFISIDEEEDISAFEKILTNHDIPWRTLYAYQNNKEIRDRYTIQHIPLNIFVSPDMKFDHLDIRRKSDRERVYSILK